MEVTTEIKRCNRHGYPPGNHENYFNGNCIWCMIEDSNQLRTRIAELEVEVADLRDTENILSVKLAESVSDYEALEAKLVESQKNHKIALTEFYDLAALYSPLKVEHEKVKAKLAALVKAAQRLVDHAKNADQELWASLPDVIALRDAIERE